MDLSELRTKYRQSILTVAAKRNAENIRVFGSVVRGSSNASSDIDFLINLKPGADLIDLSGLRLDLIELLGCDVDVVPENSLHWVIKDKILQEAVPL